MKILKWIVIFAFLYGLVIRINSILIAVIFGLTCFIIGMFVDRKGYVDQFLDKIKWVKKEGKEDV